MEVARRELERAIGEAPPRGERAQMLSLPMPAWRQAKSRLIELETGTLPEWARHDHSETDDPNGPDGDL